MRFIVASAALLALTPAVSAAQQRSVEYEVSFPNAVQHEARVVATFRGVPRGTALEARMSKSSPGRYAISTFAKNVYDVSAADGKGRKLQIDRPDPYGWSVRDHDGTVKIGYTVWGDRIDGTYLSVDRSHAHMNMPATFMFAHGMERAPIKLTIHSKPGWKVATQLAPTRDPNVFTAPNMQWFMDSPTEAGPVAMRSWSSERGGRTSTWRLAVHHLGTEAQLDSFTTMARAVVDEHVAIWGEPASYDLGMYTFLIDYLPWAGGDGMEHRNSTVITSRNTLSTRGSRITALGTFSHEFFHSWNMERLRSKALEPFDFEREEMSPDLWFGEGFTNYYESIAIRRAGFYSNDDFAEEWGNAVIGTIRSPARNHGSPVDMSRLAPFFDGGAFLDPTNRQNIFLSYYQWGAIIALGLDLTLRERYNTTLDDYMRLLWREHGRHQSPGFAPERPYTHRDLRDKLASLTRDTAFANDFFRRFVDGRDVPDFAALLAPAGFRLTTDSVETPYLGASLADDSAGAFVNWSQEVGSFHAAGIVNGDVVYAVDGARVTSVESLNSIVQRHRPGDVVQVGVFQQTARNTVPMKIAGRRAMTLLTYEKAGLPVTQEIQRFRTSWLGSKVAR